jgi:hypothetical protein
MSRHKKAGKTQRAPVLTPKAAPAAATPEEKAIVPVIQKSAATAIQGEDIDLKKLLMRDFARQRALAKRPQGAQPVFTPPETYTGNPARLEGLKSYFYDPLSLETNYYGSVRTISPFFGKQISYRILRRVSEKAWILNLCIQNLTKKIRPYLKPATEENQRGFKIKNREAAQKGRSMSNAEKETVKALESFFMRTGDNEDENREDDLDKYATKIVRDICQLDQVACEKQFTYGKEACAFWAVDPATIEVALPGSERVTGIKYAQVINHIPYAYYSKDELIFDCMNPRTDVEKAGYGYSIVEQAIDLVTSSINTFAYNAGFFTENRMPRGILLLNGDADQEEIDAIEDYIVNLLSGQPSSQWRVPIIPSGKEKGADSGGRRLEFVNLQGTNKEMEFQAWYDLQLSAVVAMFGFSMEDLGLHSQKSQPLIGMDTSPKQEASKSLVLGDMLGFLQKHFNKILAAKNPDYEFEFVGYEKDDPRLTHDLDKGEVESYKTMNEKRAEKGMEPIDFTKIENPADMPINSYTVQLFQGQQQGGMGGGPFGDTGDMEGMDDEGGGDFGQEGEENADEAGSEGGDEPDGADADDGWGDIEAQQGGGQVKKSLGAKNDVVRIIV